jgi:hypothetical protein
MSMRFNLNKNCCFVALSCAILFSTAASGQDKVKEKNPLGFRTDFGLELTFGGHLCSGGGGDGSQIECSGNNKGWDMGTGLAVAGRIRPLKFFSIGLEFSYMGLRPKGGTVTDQLFKRFFDLGVGPVFKFHIPIRIRAMLLDISLGLKTAFVNGFLYAKTDSEVQKNTGDDSRYHRHRLFGPEISGIIGADLYVIPKLGFGVELRPMATLYQTVCFDDGSDHICRGAEDDSVKSNRFGSPFKILFGLHVIYYL